MTFVSSMKMEKNASVENISNLLSALEGYMNQNPPIPTETFTTMLALSEKVDNEKLHQQCIVAQARCLETAEVLDLRHAKLAKAKEQLDFERQSKQSPGSGNVKDGSTCMDESGVSVWEPSSCVQWPEVVLRRRSYAGKASLPQYSPTALAFKENLRDSRFCEYEENMFREVLITEDMSHRVVTSLPNAKLSKDNLHNSRDNIHNSSENVSQEQKSSSLPRDLTGLQSELNPETPCVVNKENRPHRRVLRKSSSWATEETQTPSDLTHCQEQAQCRRGGKTLSMITGSSESLPRYISILNI